MKFKETEREIVAGIQLAYIRIQWTQQWAFRVPSLRMVEFLGKGLLIS
jgi:hypothetical protein